MKKSIIFTGIRGIPANYSGFETFVEQISIRLTEKFDITVFCRKHFYNFHPKYYKNVRLVHLYALKKKQLETPSHTILSFFYLLFNGIFNKIIYICGVGNAFFIPLFKLLNHKVIINVDGKDWERDKWGKFAKWYLKTSEKIAVIFSDLIIADSKTILKRYKKDYNARKIIYIPYGARIKPETNNSNILDKFHLSSGNYFLFVSRLEPENKAHILIKAFKQLKTEKKLVIVGDAPYAIEYKDMLTEIARDDNRIIFTGFLVGNDYITISRNAYAFVLPSNIDGTRPVLLDQMGMKVPVIVSNIEVNREVTGGNAIFFEKDNEHSLKEALYTSLKNPQYLNQLAENGLNRIINIYNWDKIAEEYTKIFQTF